MTKLSSHFKALLFAAVLICPFAVWGDVTIDQLSFAPVYNADSTQVTGYSVSRNDTIATSAFVGALVIPSTYSPSDTIEAKPVVAVANRGFWYCESITSLVIPEEVDTIGESAFDHCSGLQSITFNPGLKFISGEAFFYCRSLKELVLPETLEAIGENAFTYCSGLESITLPASINDYGPNAFAVCTGLKKVINKKSYGVSSYYNLFSTDYEKFVYGNSRYMGIYNKCELYYPFGGSYDQSPWAWFANKKEGLGNHVLEGAVLSHEAGTYDEAFTLTLTNPNSKGTIYYILYPENGLSVGTVEYTGAFEIGASSTVKVWISDGEDCSDVVSATYEFSGLSLEVAGIQVTSSNCYDVLSDKGSVTFNTSTNTLSLTNANINTDEYKSDCGINASGDDLTIELYGDNVITSSYLGINYGYDTGGTLTIRGGDTKEGLPSLTINFTGKWGQAAMYLYLASLNIENCNVYLRDFTTGIEMKAAPKEGGMLYIENSTLDITSTEAAIRGVYDFILGKGTVLKLPSNGEFVSVTDDGKETANGGICVDGVLQSRVVIGPEVASIPQIETEKTIDFSDSLSGDTNLDDTTVDDVHYNLSDSSNGYNDTDNCIDIATPITSNTLKEAPTAVVDNPYIPEEFQGMIVVVGGTGTIDIESLTTTTMHLEVKVGSDDPVQIASPTKGTTQITYDTKEPVYAYIYVASGAGPLQSVRGGKTIKSETTTADPVKIYSLKVTPINVITSGIDAVTVEPQEQEAVIYDLYGRRCKEPLTPGIYIVNGKKIIR